MTQPTITTKLVRAGVTLAQGPVVPIADDGTTIELTLPAGTELGAANLQIQVPDDSDPQDLRAASTIVSSAGAWTPATDLTWLSLDWGARRGLVKLTVTFPDKTGPTHLRLRIADAGPWILATPAALVERAKDAVSISVQLPGLAASRILIEPVNKPAAPNSPEDYVPVICKFSAVALTGARRPPTLTVSVAPAAVVHHEASLLPPAATLNLREPLLAALRKQLPGRDGGTAQIVVRSSAPAELRKLALTLGVRRSVTRWKDAGAELALAVRAGVDAVAIAAIDAHPQQFAVRILSELRPELPPPVPPLPAQIAYAHRCSPESTLAQSFHFVDGGALVGLDLWLAARSKTVRGELRLFADERGSPAATPLASFPLALDEPAAGIKSAYAWRSFDLREALVLAPGAVLWAALELGEGEAFWALAQNPGSPVGPLLRRERAESWVPRNMTFGTGPSMPWALTRPRLRNDGPPLPLALTLRRGDKSIAVDVAADGWLRLAADALAPLNLGPADAALALIVRSPSAGRVLLRELQIDLPPQSSSWSFTTPP
jgi:hypothetical protein